MSTVFCPYSTYQRALSSRGLSIAEAINKPATFNEAIVSRLSTKAKQDPSIVAAVLASAREHLQNDWDIMATFRL